MAFNNGFPIGYQPTQMYYPNQIQQPINQVQQMNPVQQPQVQPQSNSSGIIWVQGEAGAKSYLVAPNATVQLWDSESQTIYLKSADASGMPSMKILDYTIRNAQQANVNNITPSEQVPYVTYDEFKSFKKDIEKQIMSISKKEEEYINE